MECNVMVWYGMVCMHVCMYVYMPCMQGLLSVVVKGTTQHDALWKHSSLACAPILRFNKFPRSAPATGTN